MSLIYVLEDDKSILEIEEYALTASSYEVRGFETAAEFGEALGQKLPDLIILDIMLPDADGNEILKDLRQHPKTADIPVIMVTAKSTELDKVRGFDLGADDYIAKPFGVLELISRVKARLRRQEIMKMAPVDDPVPAEKVTAQGKTAPAAEETPPAQDGGAFSDGRKHLAIGNIVLDDDKYEVTCKGEPLKLTYKEYYLLRLLMDRAGTAVTREEILSKVWDTDFAGESRTLDMHIRTLRKKLGEEGKRIRTLRNIGYTLDNS